MALESSLKIKNNSSAKTGVLVETKKVKVGGDGIELELVTSGVTDVASDGQVNIPLAGRGVVEGQYVKHYFSDFDGANFATTIDAVGWSVVVDDGVEPPAVKSLLAIGDSFTFVNGIDTGERPAKANVTMWMSNYWCTAGYIHSTQDYIYRPPMGKSGEQTTGMLNKIEQYKSSDADFVMLLIGANDFLQVPIETTKSNYTTIVNELLASGKQVLCVPVTYRNNGAESADKNLLADELNAHILTLVSANADVFSSEVDTELNALMMTHGNDGTVSDDGLHWNNIGGVLAGRKPAEALDLYFPSTINKVNLAPTSFSGTGGPVVGGATGVMPDGYLGSGSGATFTGPIDRGDGRAWWKVQSDGTLSQGTSLFELRAVATEAGYNAGDVLIEFEQGGELVDRIEITANSTGTTFNAADFNTELTVTSVGMFENGVKYPFRSPTARVEDDTAKFTIETRQNTGLDMVMYISDVRFYRVEGV